VKASAALAALASGLRLRAREIESWTEWIYPYRSLRLTREGWFFLGVTIAIGLAALNTGHNLFYLVFAMLVSLIVVSGLLSERAVRGLRIERRLPGELFARAAAPVELRVRNASRRRASYAVEVHDGVVGEPRRRVGFLDRLDPGAERAFVSLVTFPRRGRQRLRSFHLVTRFPFGLFVKTRIVPSAESCVVFPALQPAEGRATSRGAGQSGFRKHRLGEEMVGLRRKLDDDDPRRIHWRVSARSGEWMVTEHAENVEQPLAVFFDSRGPAGEAFERAVERCASLVWYANRRGVTVRLFSWDACFREEGPHGLRATLTFLAEVAPRAGAEAAPSSTLDEWRREAERYGGGVFVTARDSREVPELASSAVLRVA
jgi:uncharacterized protein (DUF58 family)